jgi:hypothetical protein
MMDLNLFENMAREFYAHENAGDRSYFESRLAANMAMRRSSGIVVDRARFLSDIKAGGDREIVAMGSITLFGRERACVSVQVRSAGKVVDNLLLFVRQPDSPEGWSLLAWANEPVQG